MRRALILVFACAAVLPLRAQSTDSLTVKLEHAITLFETGKRDQASRAFQEFIDVYNQRGGNLSTRELLSVAIAVTYLGADDPQYYRDAMMAYDRAISADPNNMEARVKLAELFLDKYNSAEAKRTIAAALARDAEYVPALVVEARRREFDNERGADSVLSRAFDLNPNYVPGLVLRARFLADVEDFAGARREIDHALRVDTDDADALSLSLALAVATDDSSTQQTVMRRYTARYPGLADAYVATAEQLSRVRQYAKAADWARRGTQVDPSSWQAHSVLGLNLLRLGRIDEGRQSLEAAFKGDPFNVWVKNTLDLLDTFDEYHVIDHGKYRFMVDTAESGIISLYLGELADSAHTVFSARYGFAPDEPIRVEVYRSHADFSVRTVGLAGLGALGVSFGNTIAFDSPAAKDAGPFNWASTAWHEIAHTFTLGASDMRVPRWFSEGLSVFEERRGRPGWGQNVSPAFLQAFADGRLRPASRLNDGFVRPAYPQQVMHSYYQASLLCDLIARDFGARALMEMLRGYKAGQNTEQVVRRVLRMDLEALDKRFDAYLRVRFGRAIAAVKDRSYQRAVTEGRTLLQRGNAADAVVALRRAREMFPEYGGADGAYPLLVRALLAQNDSVRAIEALSTAVGLGDVAYETHVTLADLLLRRGDTARAAASLESAIFMNPYDIELHERLAGLYARAGDKAKAIRERRAVVALKPVDVAEAQFNLAVAYRDAGDVASARRTVLRALEAAPHFQRAQDLLLDLRAPGSARP
ncbi:MAG: tetratricopeptide repeat protein [Gemmatimonadaceae bacterium]